MKTKIIACMMLIFAFAIQAQNRQFTKMSPEQRASKQTEMLKKRLNLSDEQVAKISEINLRYANQVEEARGKIRQKAENLAKNKEGEIQSVLTPEQNKQFLELKAKQKARLQERIKNQNPDNQQ